MRLSRQNLLQEGSEEFKWTFVCAMLFDTGASSSIAAPQSGVLRKVSVQESADPGSLGCPAFISVMESADLR
jgi:hypothetical protein